MPAPAPIVTLETARRDLKRRRAVRDLMESARDPFEPGRVDRGTQELERDVKVGARNPAHPVARTPYLLDGSRNCVLDRIVHPDRHERAHWPAVARRKIVVRMLAGT